MESFPCGWAVERLVGGYWVDDEDGPWFIEAERIVEECGATATEDARGWSCEAGHSHVFAEVRHAEGWEYAEDAEEARRLTMAGVAPCDLVTGAPFRA